MTPRVITRRVITRRVILCAHCGSPASFWKNKRFCSPVCRHRAWNAARRAQVALARELLTQGVLPPPITNPELPAQTPESKP